ncbi:MAG: hypothetical protein ACE5E5_10395 [Phycisphaerae bacterium]
MTATLSGRQYGLLHLLGRDRVGILQDAAAFVSERGGTTEEGISHTLGTEAVVLLYVSGLAEQLDRIEQDTAKLGQRLNLLSLFTRIRDGSKAIDRDALPLTLRISSPDFAGLLATITTFFADHHLRIIAHHTQRTPLPYGKDSSTHRHRFTVLLPPEFNRKKFLAELDELAAGKGLMRDEISHSDFY